MPVDLNTPGRPFGAPGKPRQMVLLMTQDSELRGVTPFGALESQLKLPAACVPLNDVKASQVVAA